MSRMLFGQHGQRKYLTKIEQNLFLECAARSSATTLTLCWVLVATGCRISEALDLSERSIDQTAQMIVIESLKKRERGIYRAVPIPAQLLKTLARVHDLPTGTCQKSGDRKLWPVSRMTAYRRVKRVMADAHLAGLHAMPKGLRHGFGVNAIQSDVPLNMVQRWLGHADMRTTAIYTSAMGAEERAIAQKMWKNSILVTPSKRMAA